MCTCVGSCVQGLCASVRRWSGLAGTFSRCMLHVYLSNPELPELGLALPCFLGSDSPCAVLASAPPSLIWRTECSICMPRARALGTTKCRNMKAPQQSRAAGAGTHQVLGAPANLFGLHCCLRVTGKPLIPPVQAPVVLCHAYSCACKGLNEVQQGGLTLVHALAWSFWSGQTGSCVSQPPAPLGHCLQRSRVLTL